jgi:putative hydrolase of the HAD superfamily
MIKAVLFDYGGVMSSGGQGVEITERIANNLSVSKERALELLDIGWTLYANGVVSETEFWRQLEEAYGQAIPETQRNIWNDWETMRPLPEMLEFVHELKLHGIKVGVLSNVIPFTIDQIRAHGVYDEFDFAVLSAEVGVSKPDEEIYRITLSKVPELHPEEVVFIDDQERHLAPAQAVGMQTVLAESSDQVIAAVTALLDTQA